MRHRVRRFLVESIYLVRAAGASPVRRAVSLATGVLIGCSPLYGVHLVLAAIVARFFRLDIVLVFAGGQVSYPFVAPFLYYVEMQVGAWLRRGEFLDLSLSGLRALPGDELARFLWEALGDLFLGSVAFGLLLAVTSGCVSYAVFRRSRPTVERRIAEIAARPYVEVSLFAWEWVRNKLHRDPAYFGLLRGRLLPERGTLVDVGCGRGLLLALLDTAPRVFDAGEWPPEWPPPPRGLELHGIELRHGPARIAREVLVDRAVIHTGDAAAAELPSADAIVLLDVLHYMPDADQRALLRRCAAALRPGGAILLREADASGGTRFRMTVLSERLRAFLRGAFLQRFCFRRAEEWRVLLEADGLQVTLQPMSAGTPFANVLLVARRADGAGRAGCRRSERDHVDA